MDPQNPPKHRFSRIFRSPLSSCKSRDDVAGYVEPPVSTRQHYQLIELFSPKPYHPVFYMCGPKESENEEMFPRRKVTDRRSLTCPPVSPTWQGAERERMEVKNRERKYCRKKNRVPLVDKKRRKREKRKEKATLWPTNNYYYDWSTSDDDVDTDDDETTFFSSRSLTSDSSESFRRSKSHQSHRNKQIDDHPTTVKDGFAIVKRSNDPHSDFRTSMVEMIVEKQIFGAKELEGLLQTFLSLNTCHHHRVIVEVFTEIWEALFSDWS